MENAAEEHIINDETMKTETQCFFIFGL